MDKVFDRHDDRLDTDFERMAHEDDDTAALEILAAGMPIHIVRADTPAGHVIRIHPDGREEVVRVDREAAARILGT
jgi:hypothetical protein